MNKLYLLTLVVIVITSTTNSYAQRFGLVAGFNLANMQDIEDNENTFGSGTSLKPGFQAGATLEFPFNPHWSFATGAIFSVKGFTYEESETYYGIPISAKMDADMYYIDVPLTPKAYFNLGKVKMYGLLGPYCAIGVGGKYDVSYSFMGETESESADIPWGEDGFSRFDLGFMAGTGINIDAFSLGASYQFGVANNLRNRLLAFTVGYQFGQTK